MTWEEFVKLLASDTTGVVVAVLVSVLVDYVQWYNDLGAKEKRLVYFGLALFVPLLGAVLGVTTLDWPLSWADTFWPALVTGFMAGGIGTAVHTRKLRS